MMLHEQAFASDFAYIVSNQDPPQNFSVIYL